MRRAAKKADSFPEPNFGMLDAHPTLRLLKESYVDVYGNVPDCPYTITGFTSQAANFVPIPPSTVSTIDWDKLAAGKFTIAEMRAYAKTRNLTVPPSTRKQDLIELIMATKPAF